MISINRNGEPHVLYGSGARWVAVADEIIGVRPVSGDVTIRMPRSAKSTHLNTGEALMFIVAPGDTVELV